MPARDLGVQLEVFESLEGLSRAAEELFAATARSAIEASGRFTVALSGGETPRPTYQLLADPLRQNALPWESAHVYWGDERCVPPDDPRSNARMAREALLDHVPIPDEQIHPALWKDDPRESAADYEAVLRMTFQQQLPRFDLILLGMGEEGHTASLFPGSPALDETQAWVAAVPSKEPPRVTLTFPVLNNASSVVFLVAGANKAQALRKVIEDPKGGTPLPAGRVRPTHGSLLFLVDREAASRLKARR